MGFVKTPAELAAFYENPAAAVPRRQDAGRHLPDAAGDRRASFLPPPLEPAELPGGLVFIAEYPRDEPRARLPRGGALPAVPVPGRGRHLLPGDADRLARRCAAPTAATSSASRRSWRRSTSSGTRSTVHGWVERHGVRFFELKVELMSGSLPELPPTGPNFLFKALPRIDLKPGFDGPVLLCKQTHRGRAEASWRSDGQSSSFGLSAPIRGSRSR